jgi:hypothetical protein
MEHGAILRPIDSLFHVLCCVFYACLDFGQNSIILQLCQFYGLFNWRKALAMDFAWPVFLKRIHVNFCAIAFVLVKAILRIFDMHFQHQPVSGHFGDYGRRRNGFYDFVAANHSLLFHAEIRNNFIPIH